MAETQRTVNDVMTLLADNVSGEISAQDLRDGFHTYQMRHGQIYVPASTPQTITITDTTNYFESAAGWVLGDGNHMFSMNAGNGRLTYTDTADVLCHCAISLSFGTALNNRIIHVRFGKSGTTTTQSEVIRTIGTGSDFGSTALHWITTLSNGDYISLWFRNEDAADNVTLQAANLQVITMPVLS